MINILNKSEETDNMKLYFLLCGMHIFKNKNIHTHKINDQSIILVILNPYINKKHKFTLHRIPVIQNIIFSLEQAKCEYNVHSILNTLLKLKISEGTSYLSYSFTSKYDFAKR